MGLWKIWLVGLAITIITSVLIHKKVKIHRILVDILVVVSIAVVGGIAEGWAISLFLMLAPIYKATFCSVLISIVIWMVGAPILGIFKKNQFRTFEIAIFVLVYIIASVCWAQPFINYNNNFEDINETVVVDEQEN